MTIRTLIVAVSFLSLMGGRFCLGQAPYPADPPMPAFQLPDPLRMQDGTPVKTAAQWTETRRGEVLELFRANVYGRVPATRYEQTFHVTKEEPAALGGRAMTGSLFRCRLRSAASPLAVS